MGAWIETLRIVRRSTRRTVAPHMGAWIETRATLAFICVWSMSLPTWERGLKPFARAFAAAVSASLPTWERGLKLEKGKEVGVLMSRSPHGSVD